MMHDARRSQSGQSNTHGEGTRYHGIKESRGKRACINSPGGQMAREGDGKRRARVIVDLHWQSKLLGRSESHRLGHLPTDSSFSTEGSIGLILLFWVLHKHRTQRRVIDGDRKRAARGATDWPTGQSRQRCMLCLHNARSHLKPRIPSPERLDTKNWPGIITAHPLCGQTGHLVAGKRNGDLSVGTENCPHTSWGNKKDLTVKKGEKTLVGGAVGCDRWCALETVPCLTLLRVTCAAFAGCDCPWASDVPNTFCNFFFKVSRVSSDPKRARSFTLCAPPTARLLQQLLLLLFT